MALTTPERSTVVVVRTEEGSVSETVGTTETGTGRATETATTGVVITVPSSGVGSGGEMARWLVGVGMGIGVVVW